MSSDQRETVVVDLDGTLCDTTTIEHLVTDEKPDFAAFHQASADAPVRAEVLAAVRDARQSGRRVVVMTSREFVWRDLTLDWLARHEVPYDELLMRIVGDRRPAATVKAALLDDLVADGWQPVEAWEDSDDVATMLEERDMRVHRPPW